MIVWSSLVEFWWEPHFSKFLFYTIWMILAHFRQEFDFHRIRLVGVLLQDDVLPTGLE